MDDKEKIKETLPLDLTAFQASLLYLQLQVSLSNYLNLLEHWGKQLKLPIENRVTYQDGKPSDIQIGEIIGTYKAFSEETSDMLKAVHDIVEELGGDETTPKIITKPDWSS